MYHDTRQQNGMVKVKLNFYWKRYEHNYLLLRLLRQYGSRDQWFIITAKHAGIIYESIALLYYSRSWIYIQPLINPDSVLLP